MICQVDHNLTVHSTVHDILTTHHTSRVARIRALKERVCVCAECLTVAYLHFCKDGLDEVHSYLHLVGEGGKRHDEKSWGGGGRRGRKMERESENGEKHEYLAERMCESRNMGLR